MMASTLSLLLVLACCALHVSARVYDRCELAKELRDRHSVPNNQVATWVCIAKHESSFNTSAINHGSGDHGLFQISQLFWCSPPGNGHACGLNCADLEDDDIEDDMICAKRIHREHTTLSGDGFTAWVVYNIYCRGNVEKYIEGCFQKTAQHAIDNHVLKYQEKTTGKTTKVSTSGYYQKPYSTTARSARLRPYYPTYPTYYRKPEVTTQKSYPITYYPRPNNVFSHKYQTKTVESPNGSRYKYHINKNGFVLFKET